MDDIATTVETPAAAPPPPPAPVSSEMAEIRDALNELREANNYEPVPALSYEEGKPRKTYPDALSAAKAVARARREQAATENAQPELPIDELRYIDGRSADAEVDARQAAQDIAQYREQKARQLLDGIEPAAEAPQPEAQPVEQPPPSSYTEEHLQQAQQQAQWQAAVAAHEQYGAQIGDILLAFQNYPMPAEFSQIKTPDDWMRLQQTNPTLAQQMANYVQRRVDTVNKLNAEHQQVQEQRRQISAGQFEQWSQAQDAEFDKHCGTVDRALQVEALTTLKDVGLKESEIAAAWNGQPISLRSAAAQRLVLDATRWRIAQEKARTAITKPVPQVQRPGVRMPDRTGAQVEADRLSKALDNNRGEGLVGLRTAAQLVAQRRLARS
jgi:hypothetical protein